MNNYKRCRAIVQEPTKILCVKCGIQKPEPAKPICVKCGMQTPWEYSTGQPMCLNCIDDLDKQLTIDREATAILGED